MKLVEVSPADAKVRPGWKRILADFEKSGMDCAEVTEHGVKPTSAYNSLKRAARLSGLTVGVIRRGSHVYLIRRG